MGSKEIFILLLFITQIKGNVELLCGRGVRKIFSTTDDAKLVRGRVLASSRVGNIYI